MRSNGLKVMCAAGIIGLAAAVVPVSAQGGGGNGQPGGRGRGGVNLAQIQTNLGATDAEFATISPLITAVNTARQATQVRQMGGGRGGNAGGNAMAPTTPVGIAAAALQTVLDNKDSKPDDIKAKLKDLRDAKTKAEDDLKKAEKALTDVLSQRQEAVLVEAGILE